ALVAGLRGGTSDHLLYETDDVAVDLSLRVVDQDVHAQGQVDADDRPRAVRVMHDGDLLHTLDLDMDGRFAFQVESGTYTLVVDFESISVEIGPLQT
ncbi:MAG: hypothetical protein KDA28_03555, partial [Phycisphaerales bacterium]|nr:hypothetical protein [Phycisphaerales bacterium]